MLPLDIWGIKIAPIIGSRFIWGHCIRCQDLFKNLISGVLVLVEKRFKIGDWIFVDGVIEGIVERIGFRSTVIRKFDNHCNYTQLFFAENAVINISETTHWRISWIITLQYNSTIDS